MKENFPNDICKCTFIHQDIIDSAKKQMLASHQYAALGDLFKVLGDMTRLKILNALMISEMCVCDISNLLEMGQSAISHQLRILKQARLVKYRKCGKIVYYSLNDLHITQLFNCGLTQIKEERN